MSQRPANQNARFIIRPVVQRCEVIGEKQTLRMTLKNTTLLQLQEGQPERKKSSWDVKSSSLKDNDQLKHTGPAAPPAVWRSNYNTKAKPVSNCGPRAPPTGPQGTAGKRPFI